MPARAGAFRAALPPLIFIAGWLGYLLLFYPGFLSRDSVMQLIEARSGMMTDWHSPVMTLIWSWVDKLVPGPFGMLALQATLVWGALWVIYRQLLRAHWPIVAALACVALMYFPPVLGVAGVIWKDILMWGFLAAAIAIVIVREEKSGEGANHPALIGAAALFVLLALLIRPNAVFFAAMLLAYVGLTFRRPARFRPIGAFVRATLGVGATGLLLAASMIINGAIADRNTHPLLSVALFDVAGVIVHSDDAVTKAEIFDALPASFTRGRSTGRLEETYSARDWQAMLRGDDPGLKVPERFVAEELRGFAPLDDIERDTLKALWFDVIAAHPLAYLKHRTMVFWEVAGGPRAQWAPAFFKPDGYPLEIQSVLAPPTRQSPFHRTLENALIKLSFYPPYKPWFYLLAAIGLLAYSTIKRRKILVIENALYLGVVAHMGGLFLLAPSADYRYSHFAIFACCLAVLISIFRSRRIASAVAIIKSRGRPLN